MVRTKQEELERKSKAQRKAEKKAAAEKKNSEGENDAKARKKPRFKPGTKALREIRKLQKTAHKRPREIPRSAFSRVVREVAGDEIRWQPEAITILQAVFEEMMTERFKSATEIGCAFGKKTLDARALRLALLNAPKN